MKGDCLPFEKFKQTWLFQIVADHNLSAHTLRVAYVISSHLNRNTRGAWPGIAALMRHTRVSRSAVIRSIQRLEAAGHLRVVRSRTARGKNSVNHYLPVLSHSYDTTLVSKLRHYPSVKATTPEPLTKPLIEPLPYGSNKGSAEKKTEGFSAEKTVSSSTPNKPNAVSRCYALVRQHYPKRESLVAKALKNTPAADVLVAITEAVETGDDLGNALGML